MERSCSYDTTLGAISADRGDPLVSPDPGDPLDARLLSALGRWLERP